MAAVAFLALALAVVVQTFRLNQALVREQQLRAEAEVQRARAEAELRRTLQILEEKQRQPPPAAPKP
jgi:hypothetical protein